MLLGLRSLLALSCTVADCVPLPVCCCVQPWEGDITLVLPSHLWHLGKSITNPTTADILNATRQVSLALAHARVPFDGDAGLICSHLASCSLVLGSRMNL